MIVGPRGPHYRQDHPAARFGKTYSPIAHDFGKFITKLPLTPAVEPAPFSMKFVRRAKG
jgi:hypothetical protein